MDGDKYVAMDVHKASVVIGMRNAAGKYVMESIVETKAVTLVDFVKGLSGTIHLTFEEGTHSRWLYDLLRPHVTELVVCNPRRNRLLEEGNKADVVDVQKLSQTIPGRIAAAGLSRRSWDTSAEGVGAELREPGERSSASEESLESNLPWARDQL